MILNDIPNEDDDFILQSLVSQLTSNNFNSDRDFNMERKRARLPLSLLNQIDKLDNDFRNDQVLYDLTLPDELADSDYSRIFDGFKNDLRSADDYCSFGPPALKINGYYIINYKLSGLLSECAILHNGSI